MGVFANLFYIWVLLTSEIFIAVIVNSRFMTGYTNLFYARQYWQTISFLYQYTTYMFFLDGLDFSNFYVYVISLMF